MGIQTFEEFLDESVYDELEKLSFDILQHGGNNFTTNRHWSFDILKDSAPVLIHNVNHTSLIYLKIKKTIEQKTEMRLKNNNIMLYFWTRYSYIPWHNDQTYEGAITVYLNRKWHPDYGGYFLYSDSLSTEMVKDYSVIPNIKAIIPRKNLAVLQTEQVHHCTTPVNFMGDLRITIQAFLEYKK